MECACKVGEVCASVRLYSTCYYIHVYLASLQNLIQDFKFKDVNFSSSSGTVYINIYITK